MAINDLEELEAQLADERRRVDVSSVTFSVRELVRMFEEGELRIAPSYQRKYRWSESVASTFIESIFLGLPVPPIFVATNEDFELEVVDGLQRISTLLMFLAERPEFLSTVNRSKPLRLQGWNTGPAERPDPRRAALIVAALLRTPTVAGHIADRQE